MEYLQYSSIYTSTVSCLLLCRTDYDVRTDAFIRVQRCCILDGVYRGDQTGGVLVVFISITSYTAGRPADVCVFARAHAFM